MGQVGKVKKRMTDDESIFFDTDCISSFLWVGNENILTTLYRSRMVLPKPVYAELSFIPRLKRKIDQLTSSGLLSSQSLLSDSPELALFVKLTTKPNPGFRIIGKGEASAIVLAKSFNGILGSNNLRDTRQYIDLFKLKYVTTGGIMVKALKSGLISEGQGNVIWANMLNCQRKLPTQTFSDFLLLGTDDQTL